MRDWDGRDVIIEGYAQPITHLREAVRDFRLFRHWQVCCFGKAPLRNEMIYVTLEGEPIHVRLGDEVRVSGTLRLGGDHDRILYKIDADQVDIIKQYH